jgi:hypothetical protein
MLANWQTISRELRTNRIGLTALRLNTGSAAAEKFNLFALEPVDELREIETAARVLTHQTAIDLRHPRIRCPCRSWRKSVMK